jgi:nitroimidazol reductase NimA-like FMN-containing flavoprotein (pyridoxamine 5'-phosphate oxidase superfamily)
MARLKKEVAKLVGRERVCHVATVSSTGVPHLVPVCHVLVDGTICFASGRNARKVQNLRANARAAVTVDIYSDDWSHLTGVMIQGDARLVEKGPRFQKLRRLLYEKYPHYPEESAIGARDSVIVEVTPRQVFVW